MDRLLSIFLSRFIRHGSLKRHHGGRQHLHVRRRHRRAGSGPLYQSQRRSVRCYSIPSSGSAKPIWTAVWCVERGSIADLLAILLRQDTCRAAELGVAAAAGPPPVPACAAVQSPLPRRGGMWRTITISTAGCTQLFLDADQQYSCAYFESPGQSLDDAQLAKKRHLAAKLLVAARREGARYRMRLGRPRPLSRRDRRRARHRHHAVAGAARARASSGRSSAAARRTQSSALRTIATLADGSIASFRSACSSTSASAFTTPSSANARKLLADDGVFLLHTIGRSGPPSVTNPWIAKYIFPGGYIPALSEVLPGDPARGTGGHRR